ncbi:porin [Alphaproteobacteria bacterium LSUCC0684]
MKKILLATTALVAMTGVAGADVSLSGYYEFGWASQSDDVDGDDMGGDSKMFSDSEVHISFSSASDSGLEYGATFELEGKANTSTDRQVDESSLYIKGDFGKVILGQNDYASDSFQTWMPTHRNSFSQDDHQYGYRFSDGTSGTNVSHAAINANYGDNNKVTYMAPGLGGFNFGASWTDGASGDGTDAEADISFGFSYNHGIGMMDDMMGGVDLTLTAASLDNGEDGANSEKSNSYGVTIGLDAITLAAAMASSESGGGADVSTSGFGVGYTVNDQLALGFSVSSSEDDSNDDELSTSSVTASYTIAPGLNAAVSLDSYELTAGNNANLKNEGTITSFSIQANF